MAISDCKSCIGIIDKIKAIPEIFANPVLKLAKVGKNVFWHRKEITQDIKRAHEDWDAKNFKEFGEFIGKIAGISLKAQAEALGIQETEIGALLFLSHYWQASFEKQLNITDCSTGVEKSYVVILDIIAQIKAGNMTEVIANLALHGMEVYNNVSQCASMVPSFLDGVSEFKKLESISHATSAIISAFTHHFIDMPKDIVAVFTTLLAQDWAGLGDATGQMTHYVLEAC